MRAFIIITILLSSFLLFGQDERILYADFEFEKGSKELLYGDRVVFRKEPSKDADAIDTLSIGDEVTIIEKTMETMQINGLNSNWYKVKKGRKTGYILGGLIALDNVEIDGDTYLIIYAGNGEEYSLNIRSRVLKRNGEYYGHESYLNTHAISIQAYDDRGVDNIQNMLVVNLHAEACGVDGGQTYLFNNGEKLIEAIHVSDVGDGGFWFSESLTFPNDEEGYEGVIRYDRESGEPMDDEMSWMRSVKNTVILRWENNAFTPNIREFDFNDE